MILDNWLLPAAILLLVSMGTARAQTSPAGAATGPATQQAGMIPFVLPWDDASPSVANISHWLDKPAGRDGFVTVRGPHLYVGEKRIRFFGTNMCFGGNFPRKEDADKIAARMAKFGINCVRFHHMDNQSAPAGIWSKDKRSIDPAQLDKLDYFIAALKREGIYSNINLHVSREYPDMPKWPGMPGYYKGVDIFHGPMIELQKQFARDLLTHVNPYSGLRYSDDPAIAFVEINNENGLLSEWGGGSLDAMPDPYRADLAQRWNAWLQGRYSNTEALRAAWGPGAVPVGDQMLSNGDFKAGMKGWHLETHGGSAAAPRVVEEDGRRVLELDVTRPGSAGWHVQLTLGGLSLKKGQNYTVTLRAKADPPRRMTLALSQAAEPWEGHGSAGIALTPQWQDYTVRIPCSADDSNARLQITNFAGTAGRISLAEISLRPSAREGLRADETLGSVSIFARKRGEPRTEAAQRDWANFLWDTEEGYWMEMSRFLKQDLGVKAPLVGTAVGFSPPTMQSKLDVVDVHGYWEHPSFPKSAWSDVDWSVRNRPMAGVPDGGTFTWMAQRRVAGKPFICTEYNASAPNTYSSEAFLLAGAYAAMHDWDGLFIFAWSHKTNNWDTRRMAGFFDVDQHPTKLVTLPASAALLVRGDVAAGEQQTVQVTEQSMREMSMHATSWWGADTLGAPRALHLYQPIAIEVVDKLIRRRPMGRPDPDKPIVSTTGQLTWDAPARRVTIDTPRSKALIGRASSGSVTLGEVTIDPQPNSQDWAAITLTLMAGDSWTGRGARILVTATGNIENTDMKWKDPSKTTVGRDWGKPPSLVEMIPAQIAFPISQGRPRLYRLDERGHRDIELPVEQQGGSNIITLGPAGRTLWYEIEME